MSVEPTVCVGLLNSNPFCLCIAICEYVQEPLDVGSDLELY